MRTYGWTAWLILIVFAVDGCASAGEPQRSSSTQPAAPPSSAPPASAQPAEPAARPAPALLPLDATFGDLVRGAGARLTAGVSDARGACLIAARPDGYALDAELMPALHELPEPLADIDAVLQRARGPIRVLTAWGQIGAPAAELGVAAFTALPPQSLRAQAVAVLLGDAGAYLRYSDGSAGEVDGPLAIDAVVPRLLAQPRAAGAVVYVTAEDATPLARLAELLRALPRGRQVALAQLLPPGTRLPSLTVAPPPAQQLCPDGLPDPPAGSSEGELDPAAIVQALAPMSDGARACLQDATGTARAGGRVTLALRIGAGGTVEHACLLQDGIGDAALAACVLQSARSARMPAPTPAGFVDVHVPLALTPETKPEPQALCE